MDIQAYIHSLSASGLVLHIAGALLLVVIIYYFLPSPRAKTPPTEVMRKSKSAKSRAKANVKTTEQTEVKPSILGSLFARKPPQEQGPFNFLRRTEPLLEFTHDNITPYFKEVVKRTPDSAARASKDETGLNALFTTMIKAGAIGHKKFLVTNYEHMYLEKLRHWFGFHYEIYCQVSVGSMVDINANVSSLPQKERLTFAQKCHNMSFDFVLIEKFTDRIVCAIELDDPTHLSADRKLRDQRLDKVCVAANIPIFHITNINQKPDISRL